jgi:hypothetical protein
MISKKEHEEMRLDVWEPRNGRAAYLWSIAQSINHQIKKATGSPIWGPIHKSDKDYLSLKAAIFILHSITLDTDKLNEGCGLNEEDMNIFTHNSIKNGFCDSGKFKVSDWMDFKFEGVITFTLDILMIKGEIFRIKKPQ